jgi:5-(carboxyamino)imidazole ribonucleotide synthase
LKTSTGGYDGHGQAKLESSNDLIQAWKNFKERPCVLEAWLSELTEISVITARNQDGQTRCFPVCENIHKNHILAMTKFPAQIPSALAEKAQAYASQISQAMRVVGLLTVEFFVTRNGDVLINELAPRPHNSGHATIEACNYSQFDMQVLTMTNSPLPKIELISPAVMINLLGQLWAFGDPDFSRIQKNKNVFLHLYGKNTPKTGRKMGHITALFPEAAGKFEILQKIAYTQDPGFLKELS